MSRCRLASISLFVLGAGVLLFGSADQASAQMRNRAGFFRTGFGAGFGAFPVFSPWFAPLGMPYPGMNSPYPVINSPFAVPGQFSPMYRPNPQTQPNKGFWATQQPAQMIVQNLPSGKPDSSIPKITKEVTLPGPNPSVIREFSFDKPAVGNAVAKGTPARIEVVAPKGAEVWINGTKADKTFETPPLQPGKKYTYSVRAKWTTPSGSSVTEFQSVTVEAGGQATASFVPPASPGNPTKQP
jgi:uncharacterized protein (TIGR03000 family)